MANGLSTKALFADAGAGRKQASIAGSRLESLVFRHPEALPGLKSGAMEYLSGVDLTARAGSVQAAAQAIIRRLNEALDGHARRITTILLSPEEIASLRTFRHQVRQLISAPQPLRQQELGRLPTTCKEDFANVGSQ